MSLSSSFLGAVYPGLTFDLVSRSFPVTSVTCASWPSFSFPVTHFRWPHFRWPTSGDVTWPFFLAPSLCVLVDLCPALVDLCPALVALYDLQSLTFCVSDQGLSLKSHEIMHLLTFVLYWLTSCDGSGLNIFLKSSILELKCMCMSKSRRGIRA